MTVNTYNRLHPSLQFLILTGIVIIMVAIGYLIAAGIIVIVYDVDVLMELAQLRLSTPETVNALWILQIVSTTIPLLIAPVFFAYVIVREPSEYLKPSFKFPWQLLLIVLGIMIVSAPLIEFLSNLNQKMVLPPYLNGVQQWMREKEDQAQKLTAVLLQMKTIWSMINNVIMVGLFTAVVEEFMFRGCIQTIFKRWTNNPHAAIWITAILFSAFHMEFFGFLPRLMLGVVFGYFTVWSGSIWPAVWGHFINNGTAVVVTYFYQQKKINVNPDDQHIFNYGSYLFSLIIVLFLLYLYRHVATGKKQPAAA
jgi:membrane protease YdiL (CAAX protease family)